MGPEDPSASGAPERIIHDPEIQKFIDASRARKANKQVYSDRAPVIDKIEAQKTQAAEGKEASPIKPPITPDDQTQKIFKTLKEAQEILNDRRKDSSEHSG